MYIDWTEEKVEAFDKEYKKNKELCKQSGASFVFEGNEYLMSYAKYLLEFLYNKFPGAKIK